MYTYGPDAGCTGDVKLVAPGDKLIVSNSTQWEERDAPLLSEVVAKAKEGLASTCPTSESVRPLMPPYHRMLLRN